MEANLVNKKSKNELKPPQTKTYLTVDKIML